MKKVLYDVLSEDEINTLLEEYNSFNSYSDNIMNKAGLGPAVELIDDFMLGFERVGGNYYQHEIPYLPHTDHKEKWENTINVVVPLQTTDPDACLVVFDQKYHKDSVTWCLHYGVINFEVNTGVAGRPYDYKDVEGLTDKDISDEIYEKLSWASRDSWFGLTGDIMPFTPGNLLIFDNKHIHATGVLNGVKTGLSLRYKV